MAPNPEKRSALKPKNTPVTTSKKRSKRDADADDNNNTHDDACPMSDGKATTTTTAIKTQWEDVPDIVFRTLVTSHLSDNILALVAIAGTCKTWRAMVKDNVDKLNVALPPPPQLRNLMPGVAGSSSGTAKKKKVPHQRKDKDVWYYAAWIAKRLHLFPNLEDFVVENDPSTSDLGWFAVAIEGSRQILEADPTYIPMHTTEFVTDELVKSLAKNCRKLRSLEAEPLKERTYDDDYNFFVSPSQVQRLFDKCPRLVETYFSTRFDWEKSSIDDIPVISDIKTWLNRIKKNRVGTTVKKLRLISKASKDEIEMIVNTLPNLEAVYFCDSLSPGVPRHLARLSHLRWLNLRGSAIADGELEEMLQGLGANLCGLSLDDCETMTRDDFRTIGTHCKGLRYLSLSTMESHDITQGDIISVISGCGATLRYLNIVCSNFDVDDDTLEVVVDHCPEMLILDISDSTVTDYGLARIASRCKKIQLLGMVCCDNMGIYTCESNEEFIDSFVTPLLSLRDLRTIILSCYVDDMLGGEYGSLETFPDHEDVWYRYGYLDGVLQSALPNFKRILRYG
ncbi:F-box/LRR-repeat protein 20 [Pycnococcus provasolii]|eukprot:CAMPEP_0119191402 /NCGR_PEP_ID=MMETSP1316-20130426/2212_1 /TAXON_ID=41880 /ORGANISM="Pycnococcus provasolii, Strain RCC2336" /LENGTH=565 /DNA_ID=CAMNT_0007186425 /DNA_START=1 /DNA_END=1698 /DNA_ORIENTATION=+